MAETRIKTWTEVKGKGAELVFDKQNELRKNGEGIKNLGIVIDKLLNELAEIKSKKKN
jgi:hypothetical protein